MEQEDEDRCIYTIVIVESCGYVFTWIAVGSVADD